MKSKDTHILLSSIFSQWLALSSCVVQTVIDIVPAPSIAQAQRIPKLLHPELAENANHARNKTEDDLYTCKAGPDACILAFVSKMFAASEQQLHRQMEHGDADVILGFARLYSGTIRNGVRVHCVLPKYKSSLGPSHPHNVKYVTTATVQGLYVMMGRELVSVDCVRAGNIFAVRGLEGKVWRNATLYAPSDTGVGEAYNGDDLRDDLINLGSVYSSVSIHSPLSARECSSAMSSLRPLSASHSNRLWSPICRNFLAV
jgi:ribosome assembly protein 1